MADGGKATSTNSSASRSTDAKSNTSQKHSLLSYISPALFHNKRLKRKRLKWQALLLQPRKRPQPTTKTKTDLKSKQKIKSSYQLNPDVTINLVSDDEEDEVKQAEYNIKQNAKQNHKLQPLYVYTGAPMEVSKIPNITLVPVQQILQKHSLSTQKNAKRKRKARQPQRHCQPQIMNSDSIVLSDDDDVEVDAGYATQQQQHQHYNGTKPETTISPIPRAQSTPQGKLTVPIMSATTLDEEVTVSLVPRSSAGGTCGGASANATNNNLETSPFPMLPDETTVHTVISNRIYELSLAKLREGLASCGMPEFSNDPQAAAAAAQNSISPTQRRKQQQQQAPPITPPQAPISLKLSSDLSISLISDDDEEEQTKQLMKAEQILQQQTQLSVQHLQFPPAAMTVVSRPRR